MKNTAIEIFCDRGIVFSLCALIFVLPFSIAVLDSFSALAVLFYLLKKINSMAINGCQIHSIWKNFAPPANFLNRPLQFLTVTVFISVVFSQYPALSLFAFLGKFLKGVFLYFSFIEVFRSEKRIQIFLKFLLFSAFITALSGVIQHYTGYDFLNRGSLSGNRVNASFFTANGLGAYLLPVIALVVHFLFTAITRYKSWLWGGLLSFLLVLLLACLCWTYSRSSWIGYLVILVVMFLLDRRKVLLAGALFLIFYFVFLPSLNNTRHLHLIKDTNVENVQKEGSFFDIGSLLEHGGSGRDTFWKKAISIIHSSPVYGTGLNTYSKIVRLDPDPRSWWYAHNCYLQMAAETGLLGLASFLFLLFVLLWQGVKYCKQINNALLIADTPHQAWQLTFLQGTVAGLAGFLVQSFFDNTFYTVQLGILMWVLFGLMVALTRVNLE